MNLKSIGTGVAALALLTTSFSAQAADIPRPVYKGVRSVVAYYNWTGFYVGINGGYGWGTSDWDIAGVFAASPKPKGALIGGTLGYNYQIGSWVLGMEGDYDWANLKASDGCIVPGTVSCETKNSWLATVRGRIGYAFDRFLPYFTGGVAFGNIDATLTAPVVVLNAHKNQVGWTVGAGLEYAFLGSWSAKIEYLYVDLGNFDTGFTPPTPTTVSFKENIVRAGLNYKFSGPIFSRF